MTIRLSSSKLYTFFVAFILFILLKLSIISYQLMPQVERLLELDESALEWKFHFVRLLISYPGIYLAEFCSESITWGMSIYSVVLLVMIAYNMFAILEIMRIATRVRNCFIVVVVVALSIIMHGRLIFHFWGCSLLLLYEYKYMYNRTSFIILQMVSALAILFSTVSSGTVMIMVAYVICLLFYNIREKNNRMRMFYAIGIIFVIYEVLSPYLVMMLKKNIDYFGGGFSGVINMLQHGVGVFIYKAPHDFLALSFGLAILVLVMNMYFLYAYVIKYDMKYKLFPLMLLLNISVYGSVFGISAGLTGLIPCVLLLTKCIPVIKMVSR